MMMDKDNLPKLPNGWEWTHLEFIGTIAAGGTPSTKEKKNFNGNIAWITPADLTGFSGKYISRGERNISTQGLQTSSAKLLPAGTVLFSSRAPIGYVVIAKNELATNQGFKNLSVNAAYIYNEYVFYYLKASKRLAEKFASGTTFLEISASKFAKLPFPLPPLAEQKRIADKIEELFTRLDKGVEELKKVKAEIKRYRQSVLKHAFEGRLTEEWRKENADKLEPASVLLEHIKEERKKTLAKKYKELPPVDTSTLPKLPKGWEWAQLGNVGIIKNGQTPKELPKSSATGLIPFYKVADMNRIGSEKYMNDTEILLSEEKTKKLKIKVCQEGTIIFPKRGGAIATNKKRILVKPSAFDLNIMGFFPVVVSVMYTYYWFVSLDLGKLSDGSNVPQINNDDIALLFISVPSIAEQNEIVSQIERHFSIADEVEQAIDASLRQAERLRQSILKRAFQGRLVPQDPNDEPASVLLEKIKKEKVGVNNVKKGGNHG